MKLIRSLKIKGFKSFYFTLAFFKVQLKIDALRAVLLVLVDHPCLGLIIFIDVISFCRPLGGPVGLFSIGLRKCKCLTTCCRTWLTDFARACNHSDSALQQRPAAKS